MSKTPTIPIRIAAPILPSGGALVQAYAMTPGAHPAAGARSYRVARLGDGLHAVFGGSSLLRAETSPSLSKEHGAGWRDALPTLQMAPSDHATDWAGADRGAGARPRA